ncbi:MAG: MFS transporter TsgA [Gammaproteobacteria bacterium]|nr:MFS transporter TsgA [Gammaproteobacteria bacterium]
MNKISLLVICLMATFIMSGLVTPIGLLTASAAEQYGVEITLIASQFSFFIGGVFIGYIMSFFIFDYMKMKPAISLVYILLLVAVLIIQYLPSYPMLPALLLLIGVCASIAACAGGTMITRLWEGNIRQSVLVAQDAMFNGGGVVFAWLSISFLNKDFSWSTTYVVVGGLAFLVVLLGLLSSFRDAENVTRNEEQTTIVTEWNAGFILIGLSLLLFLLAKIALFVWAPQFVEQKFSVGSAESAQFMSNIFSSAFFGSVAGTWLVSRVKVHYVLYSLVVLAMLSTWLFTQSDNFSTMLTLAFLFGISISATYNSYVAFALTFVNTPTHKHIAYLLLVGGLGSALGPVLSSKVVEMQGSVDAAVSMCMLVYLLVFIVLLLANYCNYLKDRTSA